MAAVYDEAAQMRRWWCSNSSHRRAFMLHDGLAIRFAEIADVLQCSEAAARLKGGFTPSIPG